MGFEARSGGRVGRGRGGSWARVLAAGIGAILAAPLLPAPTAATAADASAARLVESAWTATFGSAGARGTATLRAFDTGLGTLAISARGLRASTSYGATLRRGACPSPGSVVASPGTLRSSGSGTIAGMLSLTAVQVAALRTATAGTGRASLVLTGGGARSCATLAKSLAVTPQVWFAPLPPMPERPGRMYVGSTDFSALFAPTAPWTKVAGRTHVFKLYGEWLGGTASEADLRRVVAALRARDIAIAIEEGPLVAGTCGEGVEGFAGGSAETIRQIRRIVAAGGSVKFVAMDEPFFFASRYDGPKACRWSAAKVASEVARFVREVHAAFPSVVVGDIEPLAGPATADAYEEWMDAFRAATGHPLPFFHLDLDWGRTAWPADTLRLQAYARAHGSRFGIIYNGTAEGTDAAWLGAAWDHVLTHELDGVGPPDDAIFQSWTDHPDRVLPETSPTSFTGLIASYVRARTTLDVQVASGGTTSAAGTARTLGGTPVGRAPIALAATPEDGPPQRLEWTGTVPAGATHADVGIRVNQEGAGPGIADLTVYAVGYAEGASSNVVPNAAFADGLDHWGWWGDGSVTTPASDRGAGRMLRVVVSSSQSTGINSGEFGVHPGAAYRIWLDVRVPASSIGSAYVAPIFLGDQEVGRDIHPLAPARITLGTATTDATGAYVLPVAGLEPGRYAVNATYAGDPARWPARAHAEATVR